MRKRRLTVRASAAAIMASSAAVGFSGCSTTPTEIVAGMTTQIQVPKHLKSVGVVVQLGGRLIFCQAYDVADGVVNLPSTLGVVPQEGRDEIPLEPVTVSVLGFNTRQGEKFNNDCVVNIPDADADEVLVVRRRRLPYISERIVFLPMPLKESCLSVACASDETCVGGVCEPDLLGENDVVDYNDSLIFGNTNTCFDPAICLADGVTLPAVLTDPASCTFRYPVTPGGTPPSLPAFGLNVEVIYQSGGTEILDLDPKEGFVFPDPNDPLTFQLAPNLCASNYALGKIVAVRAAPGCAAKQPLQPICDAALAGIQAGLRAPSSSAVQALCPAGDLTATESALYVLMDRSASMADLYGPQGLQFAVETPLKNPVAARTRMAFSFLPADAGDCASPATNAYASPTFGFDDVDDVRPAIADALGTASNVLSSDPMLFLDAAMGGAYAALGALSPTVSTSFNRRALVIVGNRDLQAHCGGTETPTSLAASAQATGIFTYVAVLEAPATAEQFGGDPVSDAVAIAAAGGTQAFNGVQNEAEGALAVQKVINDLGSCVYDLPADPTLLGESDLFVSYVDPISFERRDVPRNAACASDDSAAGWEVDSATNLVRICGQPCADLRETLNDAASFHAVQLQPAPKVPVYFTLPCARD
jgi:hypothetical protein